MLPEHTCKLAGFAVIGRLSLGKRRLYLLRLCVIGQTTPYILRLVPIVPIPISRIYIRRSCVRIPLRSHELKQQRRRAILLAGGFIG